MVSRVDLIDHVRLLLAKVGFAVSERCEIRPVSFDVVARRDDRLLIVKILGNVDAFTDRVAQELRTLAQFLGGTPVLIGQRRGTGPLEAGVAYFHRGVPVLTVETLEALLVDGTPPLAYATPGGLNVRLDGARLRKLREERSLSLGHLAEVAGVSRRAIQMYEDGMRATIEAALRLEEFLETPLVTPIDPFQLFAAAPASETPRDERATPFEQQVFRLLQIVGFRVVPTSQSPFDAVSLPNSERGRNILTSVPQEGDPQVRRRAQVITSVSAIAEKDGMIVVRRETRVRNLQGTPVIQHRELEKARDPAEVKTLIEERKKANDDDA